jgi:predicted CopG family antitoxin
VTSTTYELLKAITEVFDANDYAVYNKIYRKLYHLKKDWSCKNVIYKKSKKQYLQVLQKAFCKSDGMEILKTYDFDFLTRFFIQYLTKKQQTSKHVNQDKADITEQANALFIGERWEVIFYQQKNIKGEWLVLGEFRTNRWFRKLVHPKTIQNPFSNFFELHGGHNPHDKSHLKRKDKYLI